MLWIAWFNLVCELRPAFSRLSTFQWFLVNLAGLSVRRDKAGITSIVRALGINPTFYTRLLNNFHSQGINLDKLTSLWFSLVLKIFKIFFVTINGKLLFVGDGIKVPKEGKKMPGVKLLHQSSQNNSKAEYIMGHSLQALSILVKADMSFLAIPIVSRIHEGFRLTPKDKKTLMDKFFLMISNVLGPIKSYLVVDAYYCCGKLAKSLQTIGIETITRVRNNASAYFPYTGVQKKRGRPRIYGDQIKLINLFETPSNFKRIKSPVYGEKNILIEYLVIDLMWKSFAGLTRFCLVNHPIRGKCILMTTDLTLEAKEIIFSYGLRYKIEYAFKELIHSIGGFCYHFWMKSMEKVKRKSGDIFLHKKDYLYRAKVSQKINVYHIHIQMSLISQGLLQYLSIVYTEQIWSSFGRWLRTIRTGIVPSAQVAQESLYNGLSDFYKTFEKESSWKKFIMKITKKSESPIISKDIPYNF